MSACADYLGRTIVQLFLRDWRDDLLVDVIEDSFGELRRFVDQGYQNELIGLTVSRNHGLDLVQQLVAHALDLLLVQSQNEVEVDILEISIQFGFLSLSTLQINRHGIQICLDNPNNIISQAPQYGLLLQQPLRKIHIIPHNKLKHIKILRDPQNLKRIKQEPTALHQEGELMMVCVVCDHELLQEEDCHF